MIYFIQGTITKNIKIGFTSRPFVYRFNSITSSDELICLKTMEGGQDIEYQLHQKFAADRLHGEWFKPSKELLTFIDIIPSTEHEGKRQHQPTSKSVIFDDKGNAYKRYTKAEKLEAESQWYEKGRKAYREGKSNEVPASLGKPYSAIWYSTRNSWQWGYEQAALAAGDTHSVKRQHIDKRLRPDLPDED
jgi:hypothetical protein